MLVQFLNQGNPLKISNPKATSAWIEMAIRKEKKMTSAINIIFCSDKVLHGINKKYLGHDTLTDIVTFDYSEKTQIEGELFISVPRIRENARKFKTNFDDELHRVMIHGVLHLLGYGDKKPGEKALMRKKEDAYLSLR